EGRGFESRASASYWFLRGRHPSRRRWYVVDSNDRRRARIDVIAHVLSTLDYYEVTRVRLARPQRPGSTGYERRPRSVPEGVPCGRLSVDCHVGEPAVWIRTLSEKVAHRAKRARNTPWRRPRSLTVKDVRSTLVRMVRTMQAPARMTSARAAW